MTAADLEKLGKQIAEAQHLLTRKADVEQEIGQATKRLERLETEIENLETASRAAQAELSRLEERLDHEKKRYTIDLDAHLAAIKQAKVDAERELAARSRDLAEQRSRLEAEHATTVRALTLEVTELSDQRDTLRRITEQAKQQLASLG